MVNYPMHNITAIQQWLLDNPHATPRTFNVFLEPMGLKCLSSTDTEIENEALIVSIHPGDTVQIRVYNDDPCTVTEYLSDGNWVWVDGPQCAGIQMTLLDVGAHNKAAAMAKFEELLDQLISQTKPA